MGRRNRYREMEFNMTRILVVDAGIFLLYLLFAAFNVTFLKWLLAIIAIVGSALCLGFLYLNGELLKKRSRWMSVGFASVILCVLVSLILRFPGSI